MLPSAAVFWPSPLCVATINRWHSAQLSQGQRVAGPPEGHCWPSLTRSSSVRLTDCCALCLRSNGDRRLRFSAQVVRPDPDVATSGAGRGGRRGREARELLQVLGWLVGSVLPGAAVVRVFVCVCLCASSVTHVCSSTRTRPGTVGQSCSVRVSSCLSVCDCVSVCAFSACL